MKIELISIGDEVLKGIIVNTNATFLCRHLHPKGYAVSRVTTLPDEHEDLKKGLTEALGRADLVIATGGLGPTLDDRTREIAATLFQSKFHYDQTVADDIQRRYGEIASLKDQATVPMKAQILLNRIGTAPGLVFNEEGKTLILLPGVPKEMEALFLDQVLPWIQTKWPLRGIKEGVQLFFCILHEGILDPHLRTLSQEFPAVEVGIYPGYGVLSVTLLSAEKNQLLGFQKKLIAEFEDYHYVSPQGKIEEMVHAWFVKHRKTLAFAESCTGGTLASCVTSLPGASNYFLGSIVTYSNKMKEELLEVSKETLRDRGAVSKEVVLEMLEGVFKKTDADFAIAVTGIAGPTGGSDKKPVGTIWAALGERGKTPDVGTFLAKGNRQTIILSTTHRLLGTLWQKVEKGRITAFN